MKVIIVGLGVQGYKRRKFAGSDYVASVDPVNVEADYKSIENVPLNDFDAALCCVPDGTKIDVLTYFLENGKHVLVEKPLWAPSEKDIANLQALARFNSVQCYTAYNHRFEPHFMQMRDLIASGEMGDIYRCRMFYGNGTARLVRNSAWRDRGAGVLPDLASHLLDTAAFWFGPLSNDFQVTSASCFENKAPDHVVIAYENGTPKLEFEMTLLQWRNHFTCDLIASGGSAHICSLCKWGPSTFTKRTRILPSGRPKEEKQTLIQEDPTWSLEYDWFKALCKSGKPADLSGDLWLAKTIRQLTEQALSRV